MRNGVELVTSENVKEIDLNYIVRKLWECRFKYGDDCSICPDLKTCVDAYDARCGKGLSNVGCDKYALANMWSEAKQLLEEMKDAKDKRRDNKQVAKRRHK